MTSGLNIIDIPIECEHLTKIISSSLFKGLWQGSADGLDVCEKYLVVSHDFWPIEGVWRQSLYRHWTGQTCLFCVPVFSVEKLSMVFSTYPPWYENKCNIALTHEPNKFDVWKLHGGWMCNEQRNCGIHFKNDFIDLIDILNIFSILYEFHDDWPQRFRPHKDDHWYRSYRFLLVSVRWEAFYSDIQLQTSTLIYLIHITHILKCFEFIRRMGSYTVTCKPSSYSTW